MRGAIYFLRSVGARGGFADELEFGFFFQGRIGGRRQDCRGGDELRVGKLRLVVRVKDGAIFGATFGVTDVPLDGGGGDEHFAGGGAGFAESFVGSSNAEASAGELIAVFGIEIGFDDLHAAPIAAEFLGDDHGERGSNALAHLGFAAPDFDFAVGRDLQPGVGRKGRGLDGTRCLRSSRRFVKIEREEEAGASGGGSLQERTACNV